MIYLCGDNGKENGNYYSMLGLYWENGKENGNYYSMLGLYWENGKENGNYRDYEGYRGSTYTTIRELGPIIPSMVWYFGA